MSMIWLEERLNEAMLPAFVELFDGKLFEPAFVELFESAFVELPPVVVAAALLSALAVGCKGLCAGRDESGVCPFAVAPPAKKNVSTDTATKTEIWDTRAPWVLGRAGRLGVTLSASAKVENGDMSISFYNLNLRNLARRRVMGSSVNCHSFVVRRKSWAIRNG
jgi:hypothetical protein